MTPIRFPECNYTFAKDQPEYLPLPVYKDEDSIVTSCWKFTWKERFKFILSGKLWLQQMTFGTPLQPQKPSIDKPI